MLLGDDALQRQPLAGPLGYGNADGALAAQSCAALALAAVSVRSRWLGGLLLLVTAGMVVATGFTGSKAAAVLAAVILIVAVVMIIRPGDSRTGRRAATAGAVLLLGSVGLSVLLGLTYEPGERRTGVVERLADETLTGHRQELWYDALQLVKQEPLLGVGPGRFQDTSPLALRAPLDDRWAHSGYLQQAAETGIVGGLLAVALTLWAFAYLRRSPRGGAVIAVAAAGLTALTVQAAEDYILHFAAVPLIAAGLLGVATAPDRVLRRRASSRAHRT